MGKLCFRFLILVPLAGLLTSCGGGFSSSVFSKSSYCGAAGCTDSTASTGASVYFGITNNTITKQYNSLLPSAPSGGNGGFLIYLGSVSAPYPTGGVNVGQDLQVSGTCNADGAASNIITYTVTGMNGGQTSTPFATDIYGVPYVASPGALANLAQPQLCPAQVTPNCPSTAGQAASSSCNCLRTAICENGKFTLTVTPPHDTSVLVGGSNLPNALNTCFSCAINTSAGAASPPTEQAYQLNVQLWTGPSMSALSPGPTFSGTFYVQL